ncbi:MAG TPA: hypoxanthine phosphoribosyltransferase [Peptococcaceae bacterium]|nr:MAG: Hypoxanthine phosphoribosyltransferase [Clostridia bacterium 41_269]HBT20794.1 hypoxanthine phosphoribosyltransferase [Peptococcaceae bacterium]
MDQKGKIIIPEKEIRKRVEELAEQISRDYEGLNPIIITVLRGAVYFMVDLTRHLTIPHRIDFLAIASYGPATQTGVVRITKDLDLDIHNEHVLILEDIVDTGLTLHYLLRILKERGPASIKICAFLDRAAQRIANLNIDYKGFEIGEDFVVGYGLDREEKYRNLPYIMAVND